MPRPASFRLVFGSVSAVAILTILSACSQPASFATVDLARGSNGPIPQIQPQAFNASRNDLPVYQPTALNGPQSFPGTQIRPQSQLTSLEVPGNQVASLGGSSETFGVLDQQRGARQFSPIASSPVLARQEFRPPQQSFSGDLRQSPPSAFSQSRQQGGLAPFEPVQSFDRDTGFAPQSGFQERDSAPPKIQRLPRRSVIEETALQPIPSPVQRPNRPVSRDLPSIGEDYATVQRDIRRTAPPVQRPNLSQDQDAYGAWQDPRIRDDPFGRTRARAPSPVSEPARPRGSNEGYSRAALDLLLAQRAEQERFAAPQPQLSAGLNVPRASNRYTRPYDLLRPGIWPELENPAAGFVQAPNQAPPQQFGARPPQPSQFQQFGARPPQPSQFQQIGSRPTQPPQFQQFGSRPTQPPQFQQFGARPPQPPQFQQFGARPVPPSQFQQPISRASERFVGEYEIKQGDTLLTIAQAVGTTPDQIAYANNFAPEETIYIGQKLKIPARPSKAPGQFQYEDTVLDIVSAEGAGSVLRRGITPGALLASNSDRTKHKISIQRASIPLRDPIANEKTKSFSWPIHGKVYRLDAGQIEIEGIGNAPVAAAAAGKVVHVERGNMGVLVVIEHVNGWRSLTVGLDYSEVRPGTLVKQGQMIGKSSRDHRVRFELRDANASVTDALKQLRG